MNSKKTKRLLSFVICVIIAVACVVGVYDGIAVATVGNKQFYEKGIATQHLRLLQMSVINSSIKSIRLLQLSRIFHLMCFTV